MAGSHLSLIENGKRELKLGELQKLARLLGTSLDELLSPEPPSRRAALTTHAALRRPRAPRTRHPDLPALQHLREPRRRALRRLGCGALAVAVGDTMMMLQYSIYSVISPEGCASILWKTAERASDAAEALGITAHRLKALGVIDKIVNEPVGGAHRDHKQMAAFLKRALNDALRQVSDLKVKELLDRRYERLQSYGRFTDTKADAR